MILFLAYKITEPGLSFTWIIGLHSLAVSKYLFVCSRLLQSKPKRTEMRGHTNSPTSMTSCSPANWAANGD